MPVEAAHDSEFAPIEMRVYLWAHAAAVLVGGLGFMPILIVLGYGFTVSFLISAGLLVYGLVKLRFGWIVVALTDCGLTFAQFLAVLPLVQ